MAESLGVAVGTLRRALAILEERGLLRRVQGSGNYVEAKAEVQSVYEFFRLELINGGGFPTARFSRFSVSPKITPCLISAQALARIVYAGCAISTRFRLCSKKFGSTDDLSIGSCKMIYGTLSTITTKKNSKWSSLRSPIKSVFRRCPDGLQTPLIYRPKRPAVWSNAWAMINRARSSNFQETGSTKMSVDTQTNSEKGKHHDT